MVSYYQRYYLISYQTALSGYVAGLLSNSFISPSFFSYSDSLQLRVIPFSIHFSIQCSDSISRLLPVSQKKRNESEVDKRYARAVAEVGEQVQ